MSRRVRPIAALACFAFATMGAVVSTTAAAQACADNRPTASVPLPGFRFTPERLEHWVGGRRAPPPVATLADATVRYVIDCGRTDPRLLYPTRIAEQLSASLADWEALTDDVQQRGRRFGTRFLSPAQLHMKAASLATFALADPAGAAAVDAFLRRRSAVYGLVTAAARGDRDAAARYAGLAAEMAADPFVRDVFDGATLARSVEAELNSLATLEGLDMVIRWRARALIEMLNAGSAERARAAFARVEPNTTGPLAEEDEIRARGGSAGAPASGERRTRTVQDCSWDTGYEFVPGEGEAQRVEKFVCRDLEIEE